MLQAIDGVEAMERFLQEPSSFDLLISDILMPRMDGPTLVSKGLDHRPELPIVLITGHSDGRIESKP